MNTKQIGFFDVDSLESGVPALNDPAPVLSGLKFRERMKPHAHSLNVLCSMALEGNHPFAFCTCCSGTFVQPGEREDTLFIPVDETQTGWKEKASGAKLVYIEKTATGNPVNNYEKRCFLTFLHNRNATAYFEASPVQHWIVFGNGLELCIFNAIKGLLDAGKTVWLIDDSIVQSAQGYGLCGTPEGRAAALESLRASGVQQMSLDAFKQWYYGNSDES